MGRLNRDQLKLIAWNAFELAVMAAAVGLLGLYLVLQWAALSPARAGGRVVAGEAVAWSDWPAVVALDLRGRPNCTATLIAPDAVLTAGHCVYGHSDEALWVRGPGGRASSVRQALVHPLYSPATLLHDVALLRLAVAFDGIAAMPLADAGPSAGEGAEILGWGRTAWSGGLPAELQRGTLAVIARADCGADLVVADGRICLAGASTTCPGDSGGPVIVAGRQAGIHSVVRVGCPPGATTAATSVAAYREWIALALAEPRAPSGWWYLPAEPGRGWAIGFSGDVAYIGRYVYDAAGRPTWDVVSARRTGPGRYDGALFACVDPASLPAGTAACRVGADRLSLAVTGGNSVVLALGPERLSLVPFTPRLP